MRDNRVLVPERGGGPAAATGAVGAVAAPLFGYVEPALSTLVSAPPPGPGWAHEIKFDGYRMLARLDQGRIALLTRRGNDWTDRLPGLATALAALPVETAFLDGELVALDSRGASSFGRLQEILANKPVRDARALAYYVFDLLYLDGADLRNLELAQRKAMLGSIVARLPSRFAGAVRLSEHVSGQGAAFFAQAARLGVEGVVSKKLDAPYRSGRGHAWVKAKCAHRQELVVVGFSKPKGSRQHFGALLLAAHAGDELVYRGRVGTGFTEEGLRHLHARLASLGATRPGFVRPPALAETRDVHWVRPELVVEVSFAGVTREGLLRHAVFLGPREDKAASDVAFDEEA